MQNFILFFVARTFVSFSCGITEIVLFYLYRYCAGIVTNLQKIPSFEGHQATLSDSAMLGSPCLKMGKRATDTVEPL